MSLISSASPSTSLPTQYLLIFPWNGHRGTRCGLACWVLVASELLRTWPSRDLTVTSGLNSNIVQISDNYYGTNRKCFHIKVCRNCKFSNNISTALQVYATVIDGIIQWIEVWADVRWGFVMLMCEIALRTDRAKIPYHDHTHGF